MKYNEWDNYGHIGHIGQHRAGGDVFGAQEGGSLAWLDGLSDAEPDRALAAALTEWCESAGTATAAFQDATPRDEVPNTSTWATAIEPVWCKTCGSAPWWDFTGRQRCEKCDPPHRSDRVATAARRLAEASRGRTRQPRLDMQDQREATGANPRPTAYQARRRDTSILWTIHKTTATTRPQTGRESDGGGPGHDRRARHGTRQTGSGGLTGVHNGHTHR